MGENVLYVGNPGGAKSTLSENFYRIVGGIDQSDFANVPHRADLSATRLVGETSSAVRTTTNAAGESNTETISSDIQPIITRDSKIIRFDEVNRLNPYTANAALGILADRKIQVGDELVPLKNLEMVVSAMNPASSLQSTFKLDPALASRQAMGVVLGATNNQADRLSISDKIWAGWYPTPEKIEAVIHLHQLHILREAAKLVIVSDKARANGSHAGLRANDALASMRAPEADGRINVQLSGIARTLALLRGRTSVDTDDINDAVEFTMTARMSAIGKNVQEIKAATDNLKVA